MFRRVLTVYLAFLTVAAPCLCCCTAGRLLAAPPPTEEKPAAKAPCCCHDAEAADESQPISDPHSPAPEKRCPCRDHSDMQGQVTVAPKAVDLDLLGAGLYGFQMAAPAAIPLTAADRAGLADVREPFPSPSDLLHVHHRLRC